MKKRTCISALSLSPHHPPARRRRSPLASSSLPLPRDRDEAERFPFSLDCETIFYRGALAPRRRGFIIYAMGYANYDKVQIFHMTCTCVTPLSTRDRLTRHVNRDARATYECCAHTYTYMYVHMYMQRSKFRRVSWDPEVIPPKYTQHSVNYIPCARPRETYVS